MSFVDIQFPSDISYGSDGGPQYSTTIQTIKSGYESRNQDWVMARYYYDVAYGVRTHAQLEGLTAFFHAMRGQFHTFRYKDWADYEHNTVDATAVIVEKPDGDLQLAKQYGTTNKFTRYITKPINGTIEVNGSASGFTLDYASGIVQGASVVAGSTWTGEFDVHCRFNQDEITTQLEAFESGSTSVGLIEVRS